MAIRSLSAILAAIALVSGFSVLSGLPVTLAQQPTSVESLLGGISGENSDPSGQPNASRQMIRAELAQISCIHKIQMAAQADGLIEALLVEEGSVVQKGDTVLVIDSRVAQAELEVAKRQLESAEIIAAQTANIEFSVAARELAFEEYEAEKELFKENATTLSSLKRKRLEGQKTGFQVDMAEDDRKKAELDSVIAKQQVMANEVKLELYKVLAPYDGIIVERKRDLGEWIRAGEPVLRLINMLEMKVDAQVPLEGIAITDLEGAEMEIRVPISPEKEINLKAQVSFVSPELELKRVRVSARIENQKINGSWILRDGMPATVYIIPAP